MSDPMAGRASAPPFHNMALMSPASTAADADTHAAVFAPAADELLA